MKLLVQEFLKNKTFGDLAREHGVYASFSQSGHLFSLNYDQIEAKESDPLSQQCRGLVLTAADGRSFKSEAAEVNKKLNYDHICPGETSVAALPMSRFFNYGQGNSCINLKDKNLVAREKVDGTLCIIFKDKINNKWCVATRSVPEADIPIDGSDLTFRSLFEKALKDFMGYTFDEFCNLCNEDYTYCFELVGPYNRIVVRYDTCQITLLAVRDNLTGKELPLAEVNLVKDYNFKTPKIYHLNSVDELIDWVNSTNPIECEGVVLQDSNFNRVKVKSASYVAYNKIHDLKLGTNNRNCLEIILLEKEDDVFQILPEEICNKIKDLKFKLINLIKYHDDIYLEYHNICSSGDIKSDKKYFAELVLLNTSAWSAPLFAIFNNKAKSTKDFIMSNKKNGSWNHSFLDQILNKI